MIFSLQRLFRTIARLDETTGPPWPMQVWNPDTQSWDTVGIAGAEGPVGPTGGGPLALCVGQSNLLDWGYVTTTNGLAVLTDASEPIATQWPSVAAQPDLVLTAAGDIIRCD